MPELPEVETVRAGVAEHVLGRQIAGVEVLRERSVRRQEGGPAEFAALLLGRSFDSAVRRGKFLWLPLRGPDGEPEDHALLVHLGMSGQVLVGASGANSHLRVRLTFADGGQFWFVDQRTFGYLMVADLVPTDDGGPGGLGAAGPAAALLPAPVAHIARDSLDPLLADPKGPAMRELNRKVRRGKRGIKRALLDQGLISGIGNIYADEALWRAQVHYARPTDRMRAGQVAAVLEAAAEVMRTALAAGGTSFDALYVDVNGASGSNHTDVYARHGMPCNRCGATIVREKFMGRSSHFCPVCQRRR